mgnify:CR=1 FL=1
MKRGDHVRLTSLLSERGQRFDSLRAELWTATICTVDGFQTIATGRKYARLIVPGVEERIDCPVELLEIVR